jgi:hypothetical protein
MTQAPLSINENLPNPVFPSFVWHWGEKEYNNWPCVQHECEIACVDPQVAHRGLQVLVQACKCKNNWVWVWASCMQAHVGIIEAALDPMCTMHEHRWENVASLGMIVGLQMWMWMQVWIQMWMWMWKWVQTIMGVGHCTCKHASACVDRWHGTCANWMKQKSGVNDRGWTRIRPQQRERTEGDEWMKGGDSDGWDND